MAGRANGAILDVSGAAEFMGTTPKAIRQRIARRLLPFRKLGTRVVFFRDELEAFLRDLPGCSLSEAKDNVAARNNT